MNPTFLFTLGFAFLFVITTPALASNHVVDWKGDPLKVGVLYDMWAVGQDRGPIAIGRGSFPLNTRYVISKPNSDSSNPDPVTFSSTSSSEKWVRLGQDYTIRFGSSTSPSDCWQVAGILPPRNFITVNKLLLCNTLGSKFQFTLVDEGEHLYKLTTVAAALIIPRRMDVNSVWKDGEDRLCVNQGSEIKFRFVEHKPLIQQVV
ncbi:Kunitz family serine protease inhibitor [Pseudomonas aeruginosa]|uniref:Kunitz family serine protease inhibitor n=1 Tax=Pseudomonas aeruginosa TaxID=287 RepID=UPI003896E9F0